MGRGRPKNTQQRLNDTKREDIIHVFNFLKRERSKCRGGNESDDELCQKTGDILHVGKTAVRRVVFEQGPVEEAASQPPAPRRAKIDSFDKEYIRRTIHNLYSQKRLPTIRIIQDEIKEQVTISNTKLKSVLKQLGFCWRRTEDNRRVAIERPESVAARAGFLREIRKL